MWQLWVGNGFDVVLTGRVETGTNSFLVRRVHSIPLGGVEGVCRVVAHSLMGTKNPVPTQMDFSLLVVCLCYGHCDL